MDLKIFKINNGYKIGKIDGSRLGEIYGRRYYITKRPMRRDPRMCDGFIRIDPKKTKRLYVYSDEPHADFQHLLYYF